LGYGFQLLGGFGGWPLAAGGGWFGANKKRGAVLSTPRLSLCWCFSSPLPKPLQSTAGRICRTFAEPHPFPLCSEIGECLRLFRKFRRFPFVVFCRPFFSPLFIVKHTESQGEPSKQVD